MQVASCSGPRNGPLSTHNPFGKTTAWYLRPCSLSLPVSRPPASDVVCRTAQGHAVRAAASVALRQAGVTVEHLVVQQIIINTAQSTRSATRLEVIVNHAKHPLKGALLCRQHCNKVGDIVFPRHQTRDSACEQYVVCILHSSSHGGACASQQTSYV